MRPEWRKAVLRDIDALPSPRTGAPSTLAVPHGRRWTLRPSVSIAAALLCAAVGGTLALGIEQFVRSRRPAASAVDAPVDSHDPPVRFVFVAPTASNVAIVGDFNGWTPAGTAMRRTASGLWSIDLRLPPGRHTYGFVVDGVLVRDPNALDSADDDYGVPSSVVLVSEFHGT
jgi:hypothetical protein